MGLKIPYKERAPRKTKIPKPTPDLPVQEVELFTHYTNAEVPKRPLDSEISYDDVKLCEQMGYVNMPIDKQAIILGYDKKQFVARSYELDPRLRQTVAYGKAMGELNLRKMLMDKALKGDQKAIIECLKLFFNLRETKNLNHISEDVRKTETHEELLRQLHVIMKVE